jgi:hypothetical protein
MRIRLRRWSESRPFSKTKKDFPRMTNTIVEQYLIAKRRSSVLFIVGVNRKRVSVCFMLGIKSIAKYSPKNLISYLRRIDVPQVADARPVRVVAELSNNHCGSVERLKEMIALAKTSGADLLSSKEKCRYFLL